eukprot:TRINITY_DN1686_c0_g1_i1.p1 TRINITY_DN1686_c0_g1~~TRINITY_DN1686_c0_g1_i1.p1  ORF type:complete len:368 (+),score=95.53 TRINITY_DN1686_c0_g1_i1:93-1196(+)
MQTRTIDGSILEGGGQILRNCTALAAIQNMPIEINSIRAKRPKPGLQPQHLTGINLVRDMFSASLIGGSVGSSKIEFQPSGSFHQTKTSFVADTQTAGSTGLLLQIALPCILFAPDPIKLELKGGTDATMAPPIDFSIKILEPILKRFGVNVDIQIQKRGFYPKGKGIVLVKSEPLSHLEPIELLERGKIVKIVSSAFVSGVINIDVARRMSEMAKKLMQKYVRDGKVEYDFHAIHEPPNRAFAEGCGILIYAVTDTGCLIAGSALGERKKKAEDVAREATDLLISNLEHGGCVDEYLQDQLIIYMALAKGNSKILSGPLTLHTETAIHFTQLLTGAKFQVTKSDKGKNTFLIECEGIGFVNKHLKS